MDGSDMGTGRRPDSQDDQSQDPGSRDAGGRTAASPSTLTRRTVLSAGATLLASVGLQAALPRAAKAAAPEATPPADLALYRPVQVSSTDYAPTPGSFAVDGLPGTGVRGSGWRATGGASATGAPATDPQWIVVDLQAPCRVEGVTLTFEALATDPAFNGDYGATTGGEILSSAAAAYSIDVSADGHAWQTVHSVSDGTGGVQAVTLPTPVTTRWVRLTVAKRLTTNPAGLNGLQIYGTALAPRPAVTGWTDWAGGNRAPAPALRVAADGTVPLESGWSLTLDDFAGAAPAGPDVDTTGWLPATVPGTVLGTLVDRGHLPDPVAGYNNLLIPEALSRHAWWYRRTLGLPRGLDTGHDRRIWLEFDGINHQGDVWVNGVAAGTVVHPFARAAFDITAALARPVRRDGQHVIAVKVTPLPHPGTPGDKSSNGNTFVQSGRLYLDSPTYLAASGWDWMPAVRDRGAGLWDHVRLRSTGVAVLGDAHVTTKVASTKRASVTIAVPVKNVAGAATTVTVAARFDEVALSKTVTLAAGAATTVAFDPVTVTDPELWWPNGYGDPSLHDLRITAAIGGRVSDRRTTRFGIREFGYDWDQPIVVSPPGKPPLTFVNDAATQTVTFARQHARYVRIQAGQRATGWGVSMWTLSVADGDGPDLALHRTATASTTDGDSDAAANATDGDAGTRWSSSFADDQWIQVDLGAAADFDRVTIVWEQAYALTYTVQVSVDGQTFGDVQAVSNDTPIGDTALQKVDVGTQTARYVRIQGGKRVTSWGISMWTLSVLDAAGTDLALHRTATASSVDSDSNGPGNAVDGNPRTRWSSGYTDDQWIQVDLGATQSFTTVSIAWEQAYARDFVVQTSADALTWTDVKAVSNTVRQLRISVNGVPVFCRGGNWGWDELLRRVLPDRLADTVAMHRDMNFTMIRNWLGSSNRAEFYAACDENGILVWNDFWEAGGFADNPPGYTDIATDTIRRFRSHPCIVVWCGANEEEPPPGIGAGLAKAAADEDPEILYIANSAGGIVSGHGPYRWIDPATYNDRNTYDTGAFGFHTEIGMPVVPVAESMRELVGDQPAWPPSQVWNYHDWSPIGNQQVGTYQAAIDARLGPSGSVEQFATRAQFVNYENHRAMFEAWNANLWQDATGLLLWMSHPAWHSTVWQTYDYDLDVNGAYYGARTGCEPVHVQADPGTWRVRAVNHTTAALTGAVVEARLYDLQGRQLGGATRQRIDLAPSSGTAAFTLAAPAGAALHLVRLDLRDRRNRPLSQNTYWRYAQPADMQALNRTGTTLALHVRGRTATVTNRGGAVAAMVRLAVRDRHGARVLPSWYDDNYFWLLPGESRSIGVRWRGGSAARVEASAYNAGGVTEPIS